MNSTKKRFGRRAALLCTPLLLAAASTTAFGATYYVSNAGSDSNDGLSQSTPWQTVAKVNSSQFQPGDQILFQCGGQWRESLIAPSSGAAGNPITFADYGSGAKPKFWGSVVLNNAGFYPVGNGVYGYNSSTPIYFVLANQGFFNYSFGAYAGTVANSWSYANGVLYINSPNADPRTDGLLYTGVQRDDVVYSNYQSHLVFQNLVVDESARLDDNGGYGFRVMGSTDVQLLDDEAYHAGKHNFGVINSTEFVGRDLNAAYAAPGQQASGGASAYVSYGDTSTGMYAQSSEWHDISASNMGDPQDNTVYQAFVDHGATLTSLWVDGLQSAGAPVDVSNADNTAGTVRMTGGSIQNARLELDGSGLLVDGTELTGPQATIDVTSSNTTLQNLIMDGTNLGTAWYQTAILSRGINNILRFSTIYMDPNAGSNTAVALLLPNANFSMYNNALIAPQQAVALWSLGLGAGTFNFTGFNYYGPNTSFTSFVGSAFNWVPLSFFQWQAMGFDVGSKEGNPAFVNAAGGDFHPAPGSPLIDAAPYLGILAQAVPTDFAGAPRSEDGAFDIGALEHTGGVTAPALAATTTTLSQSNGMLVAQVASNSGSGSPSGTVNFFDGSNQLGTGTLVNGTATFVATLDTTMAHTLTAVYSGDGTFQTSTSAALNVNPVAQQTNGPVVIVSPMNGQAVSGLLTVNATIGLHLDAAGSYLMVDGQEVGWRRETVGPYIYQVDTTQLSNGTHVLQVWAHDINNSTDLSNAVTINVAN